MVRGLPLALAIFSAAAAAQRAPANSVPIERTEPDYTDEARLAELEGTVKVSVTIGEDGLAQDPHVAAPLGLGLDEKAVEAVKQWLFPLGDARSGVNVGVDFVLPSKQSRWHLIRASFQPPDGASRPVFKSANFPRGAGIGPDAIEEGRLLGGIGRQASAEVSFDIDQTGKPGHFQVDSASLPLWGAEAISLVQEWRFAPAIKDGLPVPARCTVDLLWGKINLSADSIARYRAVLNPQPAEDSGSPPSTSGGYAISNQEAAANLINKVDAVYPEEAKRAGIQGAVNFSALIGADGAVKDLQVISGHPLLVPAAVDAVRQWVYRPTVVNGAPVDAQTQITVNFTLLK